MTVILNVFNVLIPNLLKAFVTLKGNSWSCIRNIIICALTDVNTQNTIACGLWRERNLFGSAVPWREQLSIITF